MYYNNNNGNNNWRNNNNWNSNNNRGNWNNNNNNGFNRDRGYNNYQNQQRKHSGAKFKQDKNGNPVVTAWNWSKTYGMRSFLCAPYKGTKRIQSKAGREWENWIVKMTSPNGQQIMVGMYDVSTKRVIVKDLGMVMNPNKDYCGAFFRRRQR